MRALAHPILTVDLDALAANHAVLKSQARAAEVAPVVKADGYGLGVGPVARRLVELGAQAFFVARLSEGAALRRHIGEGPVIYVLDGCTPGSAEALSDASLAPVLNSLEQIAEWRAGGMRGACALHVDTGMNRLGLRIEQALEAPRDLNLTLLMSHLACASTPGHPMNAVQRDAFAEVRGRFPDVPASLANSAAVFLDGDYHFDLVRPGISLFGGGPFGTPDARIKPVATLEAPILQVREVKAGESIGYAATFTAPQSMRIAIVAAGYADGVLRAQTASGYGWFDGARRALLGRVSMDMIAIDVSDAAGARPGEPVELLGAHAPLDDVAAQCGDIAYEILTRLSSRAERRYLGARA